MHQIGFWSLIKKIFKQEQKKKIKFDKNRQNDFDIWSFMLETASAQLKFEVGSVKIVEFSSFITLKVFKNYECTLEVWKF